MALQQEMHPTVSGQLSELLLRWQELQRQGRNPAAEELCASHPELLEDLRRQIRAIASMEAILGMVPGSDNLLTSSARPERLEHAHAAGSTTLTDRPSGVDRVVIPGYEILGVLDQGGMGIVYKARQTALKRLVALKMILAGAHAPPEQRARFRTETEAVAELRHPNIVQIYEVGEFEGQPYFSMEFVEGGSLAQKLAGGPLPVRQAAQLLEHLAEAVAAAHERGILHRDLKPANVLLTPADGKREPFGTPKITDFGLAKRLHSELETPTARRPTQTGAILGTASYMAPEQAEGRTKEIGPLVDVYALGAILYEMLTGRPPFQGETTLDTLEQVRLHDPVPPHRLQPKVPRDLETICLKCLHKEPYKRYPSARALAEDLRRFLAGEPIRGRPTSLWERASKWARRRPALAALVVVSAVALSSLLGGWIWFTAELHRSRTEAVTQQRLAEQGHADALIQQRLAEEEHVRAEALFQRLWDGVQSYVEAVKAGKLEAVLQNDPGSLLYVLARDFAHSAETCRQDPKLRPADRDRLVELYAAHAVELLAKARDFDYFRRPERSAKLRTDSALQVLRTRADFGKLLEKLTTKDTKNTKEEPPEL